jgi:predicted ester cyclase
VTSDKLTEFAKRYAQAWCSHNPERVAAFFGENAALKVNDDAPAIGRMAIAEIARGFMRDFPDMTVTFDKLESCGDATAFHWTLIGTNSGPGGIGNRVRISGYELWKISDEGLIAESRGHFDAAEYERQLERPA